MGNKKIYISLVLIFVCISNAYGQLNWQDVTGEITWSLACDFTNNDLSSARVSSEKCGGTCINTNGCTHFTWTDYLGGTCWMKKNGASQNDAKFTNNYNSVCGIFTKSTNSFTPTYQEFSNALTQNGYPAPSTVKYTNFINGLSSQGGITTKREAAMFLAQIMHESGGLRLLIETACGNGCVNCPNSYVSPGLDYTGKRYCGRGYMQLVNFHIKVF